MAKKTDLEFITDGYYVTLFANTEGGEYIWNEIAEAFDGYARFPDHMFASIKYQIKKAGYTIRQSRKPSENSIKKLMEDLEKSRLV